MNTPYLKSSDYTVSICGLPDDTMDDKAAAYRIAGKAAAMVLARGIEVSDFSISATREGFRVEIDLKDYRHVERACRVLSRWRPK